MKPLVATVWAYPGRPVDDSPLWQSCRRLGVPLQVYQEGQAFISLADSKVIRLRADLAGPGWDALVFVDADDAFLTGFPPAAELLTAYRTDFLVGAEATCWPDAGRHARAYPAAGPPCRYVNSGAWVATRAAWEREARAMAGLIPQAPPEHAWNDQYLFHERAAADPPGMAVDDRGLLCLNLNHHPDPPAALRRRVLLGGAPPVVHGSGSAKGFVRRLWDEFARLADLRAEPRYEGPGRSSAVPVPAGPDRANNHVGGLLDLVAALPPLGAVAEVGCWRGVSTEVWALFADRVYAVDSWADAGACADCLRRLARYPNVQPIRGESTRAARLFPDGHFDLVYLDADHGYEAVAADLRAWLPKVRPGGWVAGHDHMEYWNCGGVIRAVGEVLGGPDRVFSDFSWLARVPG